MAKSRRSGALSRLRRNANLCHWYRGCWQSGLSPVLAVDLEAFRDCVPCCTRRADWERKADRSGPCGEVVRSTPCSFLSGKDETIRAHFPPPLVVSSSRRTAVCESLRASEWRLPWPLPKGYPLVKLSFCLQCLNDFPLVKG